MQDFFAKAVSEIAAFVEMKCTHFQNVRGGNNLWNILEFVNVYLVFL